MASIRQLKKDIDYLMSLALNDCFYVIEQNKNVKEEEVLEIAQSILSKHKELREKVQNPKQEEAKPYFKNLTKEMLEFTNQALEKLSKLIQKSI